MTWPIIAGVAATLAMGAGVFLWLRRRRRNNRPLYSIVMLVPEPLPFKEGAVEGAIRAALGPADTADMMVVQAGGFGPTIVGLKTLPGMILVNSLPMPYTPQDEAAARIDNPIAKQAIAGHRGWLSVDAMGDPGPDKDRVYRILGRIAAQIMPPSCTLLFSTELSRIAIPDKETRGLLRSENPLQIFDAERFTADRIVHVSADDPDMQAARAEAKRRLPDFIAAFAARRPDQHFAAKVPFREDDQTEFMWVDVSAIDASTLSGTLDNDPQCVSNLAAGDRVTVPLADVDDWLYTDGRKTIGGFSIEVLAERDR